MFKIKLLRTLRPRDGPGYRGVFVRADHRRAAHLFHTPPLPALLTFNIKKRIIFFSLSLCYSLKDVENLTRVARSDTSCEKALWVEGCESNLP